MKFGAVLAALLLASPATAQFAPRQVDPKEAYVPAKLDADSEAIVAGMNRFGFDLYAKLRTGKGSFAISPASISTAFGLAYAGARGKTAEEIASVLHYPSVADFHGSFGALLRTMDLHQNGRTLTVNNAIWLQQGLKIRQEYAALVDRDYGAGLQWVDYKADPDAARDKINRWVESKTNDKIRDLLHPGDVSSATRSILVNTVYFKSDWDIWFDRKGTKPGTFTLLSGKNVRRPLMHRQGNYHLAEGKGVKVLAMRYRGGETEMLVFLPDEPRGLSGLERSLDGRSIDEWLAKLDRSQAYVSVTLPKFRVESRFQLVPMLRTMGMETPLSDESDFSGMKIVSNRSPDPDDLNLKIGTVVHKVFIDVEEKGTEAAAATAIGEIVISGMRPRRESIFRADHPFLFLIRDRRTNAILFIGRYTGEPS
jgi:serpin B